MFKGGCRTLQTTNASREDPKFANYFLQSKILCDSMYLMISCWPVACRSARRDAQVYV